MIIGSSFNFYFWNFQKRDSIIYVFMAAPKWSRKFMNTFIQQGTQGSLINLYGNTTEYVLMMHAHRKDN